MSGEGGEGGGGGGGGGGGSGDPPKESGGGSEQLTIRVRDQVRRREDLGGGVIVGILRRER